MLNKCYSIDLKTLEVKAYISRDVAEVMQNGSLHFSSALEIYNNVNVSTAKLAEIYNKYSKKPVSRFSDKAKGGVRLFNLINGMDVPVASTRWNGSKISDFAKKNAPKKTPQVDALPGIAGEAIKRAQNVSKALQAVKAKSNAKVSRGRGAFYDKVVKAVVKENPRKTGTRAWHIFEIIMANKGGINYELLIEKSKEFDILKAGVREDVAHDLKKGRVELV